MFWAILTCIIAALVAYAIWGRTWLKSKAWAQGFFAWIEPFERVLFKKSETILMGRLLWVGGLFVTLYDGVASFAGSLDLTPITTRLFDWLQIPPDMRGLTISTFIAMIGFLINNLRKKVTQPLEIVSIAPKDVTPKVAEAIAMADSTKAEAVQIVAEAKS